ncbi:MAG TPA: hypothetical protein ENN74_03470, partial [Firmicutes bacterium]|nr:hypothetical protein [Bacillota bacterium]
MKTVTGKFLFLISISVSCAVLSFSCASMERGGSAGSSTEEGIQMNALKPIYQMPEYPVQTRWYTFENVSGAKGAAAQANFGRKGAPAVALPAGESLVLADIEDSGTIRRIWMTLWNREPVALRGLKIEMYW